MRQDDREPVLTGGCQCGSVRYALYARAELGRHLPLPDVPARARQPVRGVRRHRARRLRLDQGRARRPTAAARSPSAAFAASCGTPLSFRYLATDKISLTTGSLDEPARARPTAQVGIESRVPWLHEALAVPGKRTEDDPPPGGLAAITSFQEPSGSG